MRFPYVRVPRVRSPRVLIGQPDRPRPLVTVSLVGPLRTVPYTSLLDTGADETVFRLSDAIRTGVDLTNSPGGEFYGVGGAVVAVRYAQVMLRMTDGQQYREWPTRVGFTSAPMRQPLRGFAGCLQFFTATFHGDLERVELEINSRYPGT